ncbi:MAG TPA: NrsF family protein [Polyangiaceae bacterium]|nr:NrsF family protein [Polyangiaceae bacterium]
MSEPDPLDSLPWPGPKPPSTSCSQKIHQACIKDLSPKECTSARRRAALTLLIPVFTVGAFSLLAMWRGVEESVIRAGLLGALGWSVVLGLTLLVGLASPPGRRPRAALRWAIAVAVPAFFFLFLANTAWSLDSFATFTDHAHVQHTLRCGGVCFVVGAAMSSGVMLLWRGTDPLTPGLSGALLGLVGGMGSALGMGIFCPSHETWHVCVSHGVVLASLAVLGGAAGRRLLLP